MSRFLEDFLVTMPTMQRSKLIELLEMKQKEGIIRSDKELELELQRLLADIESRQEGPTFKARMQKGKTDSKAYNANMEEIAFDLMALFEASSTIDRLMNENRQVSKSLIIGLRKQVFNLRSRLDRYKMLMKESDGFETGVYETFISPENTETNESKLRILRKDRFDMYLNSDFDAEHIGDALQLAGIETIDQLKTNYGRKMARVKITNRTGTPSENPEHTIDKALDDSSETYWAESILVDQPITQDIRDLWESDYEEYPKDGAICEMQITLNGMTTISDIHLDPFCAYPLEVVSIYAYETEDMGGKRYELISPKHENVHQRSKKSVNQMTFQFPSVDVSVIRILLRQENYVKENYIVDTDELRNMQLWRKLSSDKGLIEEMRSPGETVAEFDKKNEMTGWSLYLERLTEWAKSNGAQGVVDSAISAMETIKTGDYKNPLLLKLQAMIPNKQTEIDSDKLLQKSFTAVNKLSYLYGAYNISVYGRKYRNRSILLTEPLNVSSNVTRITLDTVEKHHDKEIGQEVTDRTAASSDSKSTARITDIEYYITSKKNPTAKDWLPLLPIGKQMVQGELLSGNMMNGIPSEFSEEEAGGVRMVVYSLRFPTRSSSSLVLRRDGHIMNPLTYMVSNDGRQIGIKGRFYTASSVYTVDYLPEDSAWFVELNEKSGIEPTQYIDKNGETGEVFLTTDQNNSVTLKNKPFLFRSEMFDYDEREKRYNQNESSLGAASIDYPIIVRVNGEEFKNVTDYASNSFDDDRMSDNEGKVFAQIGNRIIFGKPADGRELKNITVDYHYVATELLMKAILRRNSSGDESVTPALYSYNIGCKSFDQEI